MPCRPGRHRSEDRQDEPTLVSSTAIPAGRRGLGTRLKRPRLQVGAPLPPSFCQPNDRYEEHQPPKLGEDNDEGDYPQTHDLLRRLQRVTAKRSCAHACTSSKSGRVHFPQQGSDSTQASQVKQHLIKEGYITEPESYPTPRHGR